jgi:signal transduction histidine kinase
MSEAQKSSWIKGALKLLRRSLRFKAKLYAAFAALTIVIIAASAISFFGAERLNYHLERSRLAHQVHERYLSLSSNTYQLFKQLADAIIIGDLDRGAGEASLLQAIRADLNQIRRLIAEEVKHVGDEEEEGEELVALAALERKVDEIMREHEAIMKLRASGNVVAAEARLVGLLETRIDSEFNAMIEDAIEEEEREVVEADAAFTSLVRRLEVWTTALLFVAVPGSLLMLFFLTRGFRRALTELTLGAEAYAGGRLDHRIPRMDDADFDVIGTRFNRMASELSAHRADMAKSNEALEETVRERTAELEAANKQLKETDGARRRLFADISHELRTPLTVIRGEAEIALRGDQDREPEEYRTTLTRIVDQACHTTRLVDDLLFIARSDAGQPRVDTRSVALIPLIVKTAEDFRRAAEEKHLLIRQYIDAEDVVVLGDQGRLTQVFSILIDNAIRYSNEGGEIRIRVNHGPQGVVVAIEDGGIGIEETDIAKVFQRFYRGDNAVRHARGSGLGLPVAKAIVEAHKGRIDLKSRAGEGVTVKVTLPVEDRLRAVS